MTEKKPDFSPQEEPSVLDWVKAVFSRRPVPRIPEIPLESRPVRVAPIPGPSEEVEDRLGALASQFPWRILTALVLGLVAQFTLQSLGENLPVGIILYLLAIGFIVWSFWHGELSLASPESRGLLIDNLDIRILPIVVGLILSLFAFLNFGGNKYTGLNVLLWIGGFILVLWAFWAPTRDTLSWFHKAKSFIQKEEWQPRIGRWTLLFIVSLGVAAFFRLHQFGLVIPEMFSDHAEKLWDVFDVFQGKTSIFFIRNTGREGLQMYLIAATIRLFDTGISFLSMKIGTVFFGIVMLPYMYLLGKEVGNRWVGLFAMFLTGISYWPNVLARVGLRFIFYPAFTAPVLYHLFRGFRTSNRNQFIVAGVFLGIGLHGYSPFRVVPILVAVAVGIYLFHERSKVARKQAVIWLGILAFVSLIVFLPLLRYWLEPGNMYNNRLLTRMTEIEREFPGPVWRIFLENVWNGLLMMNWSSGSTWVNTIPYQPSLDLVSGAMFVLGSGLIFVRYFNRPKWRDFFMLLAVPILMLPSTLSLAYPNENPAPNRAGGVMVVVFLIVALALEALLRGIKECIGGKVGARVAWIVGLVLLLFAGVQNYRLTFDNFRTQYTNNADNTSELGGVIENFVLTGGGPDSAWVVAFPHWVDTRLVGINAGYPNKDYAIWPQDIETTVGIPGPKLFLYNLDDPEAPVVLQALYPEGSATLYQSNVPNKDFYIYSVPAAEE